MSLPDSLTGHPSYRNTDEDLSNLRSTVDWDHRFLVFLVYGLVLTTAAVFGGLPWAGLLAIMIVWHLVVVELWCNWPVLVLGTLAALVIIFIYFMVMW